MVGGWDLVQNYDSPSGSESSSSGEDELAAAAMALAAAPAGESPARPKKKTFKVALKTVLEALAAETDDDELQKRLKKKEYKAAREAAERLRKGSGRGRSPMETEVTSAEMLQMLPHLTKTEKKTLYKELKKEQDECVPVKRRIFRHQSRRSAIMSGLTSGGVQMDQLTGRRAGSVTSRGCYTIPTSTEHWWQTKHLQRCGCWKEDQ